MTSQRLRNVTAKTVTLRLAQSEHDHLVGEAARAGTRPATLAARLLVGALERLGGTVPVPSPQPEPTGAPTAPLTALAAAFDGRPGLIETAAMAADELDDQDVRRPLLLRLAGEAAVADPAVLIGLAREIRALLRDVAASRGEEDFDDLFDGPAGPVVVPAAPGMPTPPPPPLPANVRRLNPAGGTS